MKKFKFPIEKSLKLITTFCFSVIFLSSLLYLFNNQSIIKNRITNLTGLQLSKGYEVSDADSFWAKEILNGGYILHFRHAERDKWIDVQMYDVLESDLHDNGEDKSRNAENDYFSQAVCLNERGKIQAKAMGEHISHIGLPISHVVSSVSCRSRQTSKLAFGRSDELSRLLVHVGPYNEIHSKRIENLKDFYKTLPVSSDGNVIVSAHNGVVQKEMFENVYGDIDLEEGGFYIISLKDDKLYLEHEFHNFADFMKVFYIR
jgi:phosphohistidine phosphatase SixA